MRAFHSFSRWSTTRRSERGQTLVLVAISLVSLLAMGAIAIDVVTLYVARGEAQRSADAAALAGAQELVANSVVSDPCNTTLATSAQTLATARAISVASTNLIAGAPPDVVTPTYPGTAGCTYGINPQIQVTVQRHNLPVFFARIWSSATNTVTAVATAEAYDPANASAVTGTMLPVAPSCVKPMLIVNCNPGIPFVSGNLNPPCMQTGPNPPPPQDPFFDPATGAIKDPGAWVPATSSGGIIGEPLVLKPANSGSANWPTLPPSGEFYALNISAANPGTTQYYCPACANPGDPVFQEDLECCNSTQLQCGTVTTGNFPVVDTTYDSKINGYVQNGGQCLVHETSTSLYAVNCWTTPNDQDCLNWSVNPFVYQAGNLNPFLNSQPGSPGVGSVITTSDSIITIPVYDQTAQTNVANGTPITIIGFLQVFVEVVGNGNSLQPVGTIRTRILNAIGCGTGSTGTPIYGSGPAVPVRLIANP
jgi:hypothetical protein